MLSWSRLLIRLWSSIHAPIMYWSGRNHFSPKSSVFAIEAACSNPEYAQSYLNALAVEYVEYKRNIRKLVSGDTLASISRKFYKSSGRWKKIRDANKSVIDDPAKLKPGMTLTIP